MRAPADVPASALRPVRRYRLWIWSTIALAALGTAASASALDHYTDGDALVALQFDAPLAEIAPGQLEALVRTTIEERMTPAAPGLADDATPSTSASERPQSRARRALR